MDSFLTVLGAVLPVYLVVGLGAAMRVCDVLTTEADRSLLRLTIYLLTPALIIDSLAHNHVATEPANLLVGPLLGLGLVCAGYATGWLLGGALGLPLVSRRTFAFAAGIFNYGFIPIPLVLALFGVQTLGVLFIVNVGTEVAIWTLGVVLLTGGDLRRAWRQVLMPPVVAVGIGVAINLTGATIFDFRHDVDPTKGVAVTLAGVLLRMVGLSAVFLLLAWAVPFSVEIKRIIVVQAAMPTAMIPIILSKLYNADVATSLRITFATSLISLFTIPFVIQFGLWLVT